MMTKEYQKMTERELKGRYVKSLIPMKSGMYRFPRGTIFTIQGKSGGLELETLPCPKCGISAFVTKVKPFEIELLPPEYKPDTAKVS